MSPIYTDKCTNAYTLRIIALFLISFLVINISEVAFAAVLDPADPIGKQLCTIVKTLSGATAQAVGIVALMFVAIGMFTGKINWGTALTTAIGVIVLFGAPAIMLFLGGSANTCTT